MIVFLTLTACKKDSKQSVNQTAVAATNGSIVLTSGYQFANLDAADSVTVAGLMTTNNISSGGLQFYSYQTSTNLDQNNKMGFFQTGLAMQIRNGLQVFYYNTTVIFENGKFFSGPSEVAPAVNLDTKYTINLQTLRDTFINRDNKMEAVNINIGDSTLVAQLGYYNTNMNTSTLPPNYIKAWYVHPQHAIAPSGFFRDDTGAPLYFYTKTVTGPFVP